MTRYPTITITPGDILVGVRGNCEYCPIALAVGRVLTLPPGHSVRVQPGEHAIPVITIVAGGFVQALEAAYYLPRTAQRFLARFDRGDDVESFSFALRPYPLAKLMPELPL